MYSGFMLNGKKHGPGTFVPNDLSYRMEGVWFRDMAFIGVGTKEFLDGTIQKGKFVKNKYQEVSI
jgi:hypothetical protein